MVDAMLQHLNGTMQCSCLVKLEVIRGPLKGICEDEERVDVDRLPLS